MNGQSTADRSQESVADLQKARINRTSFVGVDARSGSGGVGSEEVSQMLETGLQV